MLQPAVGYRAGVDPVLLAAATPAVSGQSVLELGCGAGAATLCLNARISGLKFTGVELQTTYADLARRNAIQNQVDWDIFEADITALPAALIAQQFDHVIANPPYYKRENSTSSQDKGRDIAFGGGTDLAAWIDVAARRLAPKGYLTMIQRADRLPDMMAAVSGRLGSLRLLPIVPRVGRSAALVLLQARKSGRADFVLQAPLIMHAGDHHEKDGEDYAPQVSSILRNGAGLNWL